MFNNTFNINETNNNVNLIKFIMRKTKDSNTFSEKKNYK